MQPMPQVSPQNMQYFQQILQQQGFTPPNLVNAATQSQGMPQQVPMPQQPQMPPQGQVMPQQGQSPVPQTMPQMQPRPQMPQQPVGGPQQGQMSPQQAAMINQMMAQRAAISGQPAQPSHMSPQQMRFTEQELGALGRLGDTTIAHLTPGEKTVPPELQTPKVLATLKSEYAKKGVTPEQFTVGSPQSSTNPQTGLHEYNFWSSFLPIALGVGGSLIAPGIGTYLGSSLSGAALSGIGAGAGNLAGNLATGNNLQSSLGQAALSGLGGYGASSLLGGVGSGASSAAQGTGSAAAGNAGNAVGSAAYNAASPADQVALDVAKEDGLKSSIAATIGNQIPAGLGAGLGGYLGQQMFGSGSTGTMQNPNFQSNFNTPYTPSSQLPSYAQQLGTTTYNGPQANFSGYNPSTNNTQAFNFFPTASTTGVG